jgi:spore coat polysaccharide biosynthesis predicted glycosyltransferase SpsG
LEHFDIGIVDVPGIAARKIESFQDASGLVVAIDDDGPGLNGQDILVRPNLLGCPRPPQLSEKNYWSGRRYIILHPDFALKSPFKRSRPEPVRRLLVCFGGSDPGRLTMRVIPLLEKLGAGLRVHLVLGAAFPWRQEVAARIARDARFSFSCNVPNMAKAFRTADAALISGGTLLYEACALGVPALVLAQNAAQAREARFFGQAGGVRDLGMGKSVTDADIYAGLERMIGDGSARNKMARKGPGLVAPDGAIRIAARLLARLQRGRG